MKNLFYLLYLLAWSNFALAQTTTPTCGFEPDAATIQRMNQHHDAIARFKTDPASSNRLREVKRVPLRFVAFNAGKTAGLSQADVNLAVSTLNKAFLPAGIEFFSCQAPINVISSPYANYLISEERALWQEFKASKVINVFCVESIEYGSVAGYTYLPGSGAPEAVFMLRTHLNQPTFAHEMGHYYGLYHTHGKSNCETLTDELVNGSNCEKAGDDVCDTPADPNLQGTGCNTSLVNSTTCTYIGTVRDKNGELFKPDVRNMMSYGPSRCRNYFSPGQYERMRYFTQFRVYPEECPPAICNVPTIVSIDSTYNSVKLSWTAFAEDSLYQVRYRNLGDTEWKLSNLSSNQWTLNNLKPCTKLEVQVRRACGADFSNWTNTLPLKTLGCGGVYCGSFGGSNTAWLNRVGVDSWTYTSGDNKGYLLRENSGLSLVGNKSYSLQLEPGGTLRIRDTLHWEIWVDTNRDRDFDDPGERVYQGKSAHRISHKDNFSLPVELSGGSSRMRLIMSLNKWAQGPCDTSDQVIETEDFVVNLQSSQTCKTPGASNITLKKLTASSVTLKAQSVEASRYQWEIRDAGGGQLVIGSAALTIDSFPFTGLMGNTRYQARLRILCQNGLYSNWSDYLNFTTLSGPCPAPDSSTLVIKQLSVNGAQMNCGAQTNVAYYQFYYRVNGVEAWSNSPLVKVNNYYVSGLRPGTTYEFKVKIYCNTNLTTVSPDSKIAQFTTLEACNAPDSSSLKASQITDQSAVVQCSALGGAVFYEFSYRVRGATAWVTTSRVNIPSTTFNGLRFNIIYEYRVRVYCNANLSVVSGYSIAKTFQTARPICVVSTSDILVSRLIATSATLTYRNTNYARIEWRYRPKGDSVWKSNVTSSSNSFSMNDLVPGNTYEVQVRKLCVGETIWTNWSEIYNLRAPACVMPDSVRITYQLISAKQVSILAESNYGWYIPEFKWRYRPLGQALWDSVTIKGTNALVLKELKPGTNYAVEVDIVCTEGTYTKRTYTKLFTLPEECFVLNKEEIKILKVTNTSARIEPKFPYTTSFEVRYRIKGAPDFTIQKNFITNAHVLNNLIPGTTYELGIRILCNGVADWSESVYFNTPNCALPYAGEISLLYMATDSVQAMVEFLDYNAPLKDLQFAWRYRLKGAATWTNAKEQNQPRVRLGTLSPNQQYEIQASVGCGGEFRDSFLLSKTFSTTSDICGQKPLSSWLRIRQDPAIYSAELTCNLNSGYNMELRYRPKPNSPQAWTTTNKTFKMICGNTTLSIFFDAGPFYEVQFRIICPSGNVSVWSDVILLENKTAPDCVTPTAQNLVFRNTQSNRVTIGLKGLPKKQYQWYLYSPDDLSNRNLTTYYQDSLVVTNLKENQTYQIKVGMVCAPYDVHWSDFVTFKTSSISSPCASISKDDLEAVQLDNKQVELRIKNLQVQDKLEWRYRRAGKDEVWHILTTTGKSRQAFHLLELDAAYEAQVRQFCKDLNAWSAWSDSKELILRNCALPLPEKVYIHLDFGQFPDLNVTFHPNMYAFDYSYQFRYRLQSSEVWMDSTSKALQNFSQIKQLQPDSSYEIEIKVFCGDRFDTYLRKVTMPSACFKIDSASIGFEEPTHESINVFVKTVNNRHCEYRYRLKGKGEYLYVDMLGFNGYTTLENLLPGATYELNARIRCADPSRQTDWSETVEFRTKSCLIPLYGDLAVLKYYGVDSVLLQADFGGAKYEPNLDYFWEYKSDQDSSWSKVYLQATNLFVLKNLLEGATYQLRVKVKCLGEQGDSLLLKTQLTIDSGQCSLPPDPGMIWIKVDEFSNWVLGVKLSALYKYEIQYKERLGTSDWISGPVRGDYAISFGTSAAPEVIWFRVICPNGNVSPWSDSILTKTTQLLVGDTAAEQSIQPTFRLGANLALRISPNPSVDQFKVVLPVWSAAEQSHVLEVFNLSGQKVLSEKLEGVETTIDMSAQPSGMYFLRANVGKQVFTERILLQKP